MHVQLYDDVNGSVRAVAVLVRGEAIAWGIWRGVCGCGTGEELDMTRAENSTRVRGERADFETGQWAPNSRHLSSD